MLKIAIPKPCHEDWNKMNPAEQGRHCNVCCKTVVDFTSMSDEEVKYFFVSKKKEESVCGRFKNEQLQRISITLPYNIYKLSMPLWKQFLTACLLAFSSMLFSCDALVDKHTTGVMMSDTKIVEAGKINTIQIDTTAKPSCYTLMGDTVAIQTISQGEAMIEPYENIIQPEVLPALPVEQIDTPQRILTGKVVMDIDTTRSPKKIDSVKTQRPIKKDSSECDNKNFINL